MTWTKISKKYEDTESMEEFQWYRTPSTKANIKDIWGYFLIFAKTRKVFISVSTVDGTKGSEIYATMEFWNKDFFDKMFGEFEQAMLWCVNKFFEIA